MAKLDVWYFHDGTETGLINLDGAHKEPALEKALQAGTDDLAKIDLVLGWFAKNPRKIESVAVNVEDEALLRRISKAIPASTLRIKCMGTKCEWITEHAALLEDLEISDLGAFAVAGLSKLPRLRRLDLWVMEGHEDLSFLSGLAALTELKLGGSVKLALPKLPRVQTLQLRATAVAAGGLAGLTGLKDLHLDQVAIGSPGALPALETLRYEGHREVLDAAFFKAAPALKAVGGNLYNLPAPAIVSLDVFSSNTALEEIDLSTHEVSGLKTLEKLPKLHTLALSSGKPDEIDLAKLPSIRKVSAWGELRLKNIDRAKGLTEIGVGTIDDLAPLAGCTELERLQIHNPPKKLSLAPLAGLSKLTSLDVGSDTRLSAKQVEPLATRMGLTIYSKVGYLEAVELYGQLSGKIVVPKQSDFVRPAAPLKGAKGDPGAARSHTFGTPLLGSDPWPVCGNCKKSMPCLLQLDLKSMKGWKGWLQLFYCTSTEPKHCEVECKTWEGVGPSMQIRIADASSAKTSKTKKTAKKPAAKAAKKSATALPADLPKTSPQTLTVGKPANDIPGTDDAEELGVKDAAKDPLKGDKIGGWPHWIQGAEWPSCTDCSKKMTLLAQLASNKAVKHQWGDIGYAYVFACEEHRERTGFCWQSG